MWEWIALAIGAAFLGLYLYALKCSRAEARSSPEREEKGKPPGE